MSEQIRDWRSAQVDREQIVLAEMPAEIKFKNEKGQAAGAYNLKSSVDFKVDNREEEENQVFIGLKQGYDVVHAGYSRAYSRACR